MTSKQIYEQFNWMEFNITDVFNIYTGKQLPGDFNTIGSIPTITDKTGNNGIKLYATLPDDFKIRNNMITITGNGEIGVCYYQANKFCNTQFTKALSLKTKTLNKYIALFLCSSLEKLKVKYSYGKKLSTNRLEKETIWLPIEMVPNISMQDMLDDEVTSWIGGDIDWKNIELYMKTLEQEISDSKEYKAELFFKTETKTNATIDLDSVEWKEFNISDIFDISNGKRLKSEDQKLGKIKYISSSTINNGIDNLIESKFIHNNVFTITSIGKPGIVFYHNYDIHASDNVNVLRFKEIKILNKYIALFLCSSLEKLSVKYSYGKTLNSNRLSKETIWLPIINDEVYYGTCNLNEKHTREKVYTINWENIELYMKTLEQEISDSKEYKAELFFKTETITNATIDLDSVEWKQFIVYNIFNIYTGKQLPTAYDVDGIIPSISASVTTNGVDKYITPPENFEIRKNMITITGSGKPGVAFYHPYNFTNTGFTKALELKNKELNKFIALFLCSSLDKLSEKYSYGKPLSQTRLENESIWLPVNSEGEPDYDFMEQYMRSILYKLKNEYSLSNYIEDIYLVS